MNWLIIPWGLAAAMFVIFWVALGNLGDAAIGAVFYVWIAALVTWQVRRLNGYGIFRKPTQPPATVQGPANLNQKPKGRRRQP